MIRIQKVTAALIKVTSDAPFGPDQLVLWVGKANDAQYDGFQVHESALTILSATEYRYTGHIFSYQQGVAQPLRGSCPNAPTLVCYCNSSCTLPPPEDIKVDPRWIEKNKPNLQK